MHYRGPWNCYIETEVGKWMDEVSKSKTRKNVFQSLPFTLLPSPSSISSFVFSISCNRVSPLATSSPLHPVLPYTGTTHCDFMDCSLFNIIRDLKAEAKAHMHIHLLHSVLQMLSPYRQDQMQRRWWISRASAHHLHWHPQTLGCMPFQPLLPC